MSPVIRTTAGAGESAIKTATAARPKTGGAATRRQESGKGVHAIRGSKKIVNKDVPAFSRKLAEIGRAHV